MIKRRLYKALLFGVMLAAASLLLHGVIYPKLGLTTPLWGSERIYQKGDYLARHAAEYNCLFIGSSMVYRQIDPVVFDSTVRAHCGKDSRSFNFGVNWLSSSELLYLLEAISNRDRPVPEYIFIELQKIKMVDYGNYFTNRVTYWYTWRHYWFTVKAAWASSFPLYMRMGTIVSHTVNYAGSLLNLGYLTEAFRFSGQRGKEGAGAEYIGEAGNGFISLEEQQEINKREDPEARSQRHLRFLQDTAIVTTRKNAYLKAMSAFKEDPRLYDRVNRIYAGELNRLIGEYEERGTRLIFFVPPRLDRLQYFEVLPLLRSLPEGNRLNMADAEKYPAFYLASHSFDATHMNAVGARFYSQKFAESFCRLGRPKDMGD